MQYVPGKTLGDLLRATRRRFLVVRSSGSLSCNQTLVTGNDGEGMSSKDFMEFVQEYLDQELPQASEGPVPDEVPEDLVEAVLAARKVRGR